MEATFDWAKFYESLDLVRESRSLDWKGVADQTGVSASTLSRLGKGRGCDVDSLIRLSRWLKVSVERFILDG